ncbi:MAG: competence/damage-inducible protein A [Alphaproteobacteria bacterium]|nr:competence/damage-inducible protein A [Alphaproteobacteria bacterium]
MNTNAAILIIGNEILSGRTKDANAVWLAEKLAARGLKLCEIRVVRDEEDDIISAVHALSDKYDLVFTTGGIGPTHDDITAPCMAKTFNVALPLNDDARRALEEHYTARHQDVTEARLRMARIPEGAKLIDNPVSGAPGFIIKNVYVMAGVPKIMQAMYEGIEETLPKGAALHTRTIPIAAGESQLAAPLEKVQNDFPNVEIGSYPGKDIVEIVVRGADEDEVEKAVARVEELSLKTQKAI